MPEQNAQTQTPIDDVQLATIDREARLAPYTDGREWNETRCQQELYAWNLMDENAWLQVGLRLVEAKNNVDDGQWLDFLSASGVNRRKAARYIRATVKLGGYKQIKKLGAGISKVDILCQADDADLEDFEQTGKLGDKDTDELASMTRAELKRHVDKLNRRFEQSKTQYDELAEENRSLRGDSSPDERLKAIDDERLTTSRAFDQRFNSAASSQDPTEIIAVYTELNMLQLHASHLMHRLEEETTVGMLLPGTTVEYDPTMFNAVDIAEHSSQQAEQVSLVNDEDN